MLHSSTFLSSRPLTQKFCVSGTQILSSWITFSRTPMFPHLSSNPRHDLLICSTTFHLCQHKKKKKPKRVLDPPTPAPEEAPTKHRDISAKFTANPTSPACEMSVAFPALNPCHAYPECLTNLPLTSKYKSLFGLAFSPHFFKNPRHLGHRQPFPAIIIFPFCVTLPTRIQRLPRASGKPALRTPAPQGARARRSATKILRIQHEKCQTSRF